MITEADMVRDEYSRVGDIWLAGKSVFKCSCIHCKGHSLYYVQAKLSVHTGIFMVIFPKKKMLIYYLVCFVFCFLLFLLIWGEGCERRKVAETVHEGELAPWIYCQEIFGAAFQTQSQCLTLAWAWSKIVKNHCLHYECTHQPCLTPNSSHSDVWSGPHGFRFWHPGQPFNVAFAKCHLVRFTQSPSMYGSDNNEPEGKSNPVVFSPFKSNWKWR